MWARISRGVKAKSGDREHAELSAGGSNSPMS
jgi:hypothetical protein